MSQDVASRIVAAAKKKGGSIFLGDLPYQDIEYAVQQGWLAYVGTGHLQLTEAGRRLAGQ